MPVLVQVWCVIGWEWYRAIVADPVVPRERTGIAEAVRALESHHDAIEQPTGRVLRADAHDVGQSVIVDVACGEGNGTGNSRARKVAGVSVDKREPIPTLVLPDL